jgi:hypothetical protein
MVSVRRSRRISVRPSTIMPVVAAPCALSPLMQERRVFGQSQSRQADKEAAIARDDDREPE